MLLACGLSLSEQRELSVDHRLALHELSISGALGPIGEAVRATQTIGALRGIHKTVASLGGVNNIPDVDLKDISPAIHKLIGVEEAGHDYVQDFYNEISRDRNGTD